MRNSNLRLRLLSAVSVALIPISLILAPTGLYAVSNAPEIAQRSGVDEHLGEQLPTDLNLLDRNGVSTSLRSLIPTNRPAILIPVYYECPSLCTFSLNGMVKLLAELPAVLGEDFSVITYSIDPEEGPEMAAAKADAYVQELPPSIQEQAKRSWHFLSDIGGSSAKISEAIGFRYSKDGSEYIHPAVFIVLTPEGKVARYFYGINHNPRDVRLSLVEAAAGRFGNTVDRLLLYCFHWDELTGRYALFTLNLVKVVSVITVVILFGFLIYLRASELLQKKRLSQS